MEFIGTEVGIKIRSAIKAKLTELGKTVDDELIDYIMVMVANKKEEIHMARDLQPFLESDTMKFTSWLHKVLQKLEQVTVIVTDEEFKIATTAFSKVGKKRKSSESSNTKKKSSSKDEPKEKKKKVKHEHSNKHSKGVSGESTKSAVKDNSKVKNTGSSSTNVVKTNKAKKSKLSVSEIGSNVEDTVNKSVVPPSVTVKSCSEKSPIKDTASSNLTKKSTTTEVLTKTTTSNVVLAVVPVQRPVMMVSDDDDDDDDFINIKTDVAEEDELLDEEQAQRSVASVAASSDDTPAVQQQKEEVQESPTKLRSVIDTVKSPVQVKSQVVVEEVVVRPPPVPAAPRSVVASVVSTVASTVRKPVKPQHKNSLPERKPSRPAILSRVGAVLKRKASHLSDEEEEEEIRNGTVASVVQIKPRPKPPPGSQAPKNLLLRAMADAHRSVATTPVREEPEPPPKSSRSPLFTRKYRNQERIAVTLPNIRDPSVCADVEEDTADTADKEGILELEPDEAYVPELVTSPSSMPVDVVYSPSPINKSTNKQSTPPVDGEQRCETPEFLVTLDGYKNYSRLSRTVVCAPAATIQEEEQEAEVEEVLQLSAEEKPKRQKIVFTTKHDQGEGENNGSKTAAPKSLDRCRFWPTCRQGDSCTFHHPTQPCKSFPSCQFGDRCLYIHPNCKFDASCTRKDCPYTHASPRNLAPLSAAPILVPRPVVTRISTPLATCRFFPNCSNTNCRFYHPKPCRFGRQCSKPDCTFLHSEFPPKAKMKWVNSVF